MHNVSNQTNEWEPSFNGDCISKRLCPTGHWVNQKDYDGGCAQSWTLVYDDDGTILPYVAGTLGVWTLMDVSSTKRLFTGLSDYILTDTILFWGGIVPTLLLLHT